MRFPKLKQDTATREMLTVFRGYNAQPETGAGEFRNMENLSSDCYPLMAPRAKRGIYAQPEDLQGLTARDSLCWVDGSGFVVNGYTVEMGLSCRSADCPKRLVSMGAYVVIFPDRKYINTLDLTDYGNLEAEFAASSAVTCTPADAGGNELLPSYIQPTAPAEPEGMALWLDTSTDPPAMMQWSAGSGMWVDAQTTYVKLSCPGIGAAFRQDDGVTLEGAPEGVAAAAVVAARGEDFLLVPGILARETEVTGLRVARKLPEMDFVIECGNRLWGCRYGTDRDGKIVNEIYASKLGDFRNWNYYQGTAADSYTVSLGGDGPFTGAVQHMGYPVFFRENCLHKIYGNYPANFRLQTTPCRGVQRGSGNSLAIVGEVLYYKSDSGICAYDGSLPVEVSYALGSQVYHNAVAGGQGGKYYISMADSAENYHLFVYDTVRKLWHREDSTKVTAFCSCRGEMYFADDRSRILCVQGRGMAEETVHWMADTGELGLNSPDNQYLSRLTLRLWMAEDARLEVFVCYDREEDWHPVARLQDRGLGAVTLPVAVRRCDHLRLRFRGQGEVRLHSITKTIQQGSDVY